MKSRPLGCLTFSALLFAVLAALTVAVLMIVTGNSIFSPGALSATTLADGNGLVSAGGVSSHAQLENRCDACHTPFWSGEVMGDRCLSCHTEVSEQVAAGTGLHGRLNATTATCRNCHTEHRGASASATRADTNVFPHDETGFALTAHSPPVVADGIGCRECHPGSSKGDYQGTDCIGCHIGLDATKMAAHTDTYGSACLNCHDGKDTYGRAFAHTTYPLTGMHASKATCDNCHHGATTLDALHSTPQDCATCHGKDDIHQGRLGTNCAACHNTDGWTEATLDHSTQTSFALTGKHVGVTCEACHVNRQWQGLGTTCVSCHQKDDTHQGRLGTECAACHSTDGWDNATLNHDLTGFPLRAAHATVECTACHPNGQFQGTPTTCTGCHSGPASHVRFFSSECSTCHSESSWSPASFDHSVTSWSLTGAHQIVVCQKCHPQPTVTFTGASTSCAACHNAPASHDSNFGPNCTACHSTTAWTPASFDHSVTSFNLTGAHQIVVCQKCHPQPTVTYAGAPTICAACHNAPASHTGAMRTNCATCHTTQAWTPATFDHSKTQFPLTGVHFSLTCARCHTNPNTFGGLSPLCASCHTAPASHTGAMRTNCAACHGTRAWTPATFNHSQTRFPLTGAHTNLTCARCHTNPNTFGGLSPVCASCHAKPSNHTAAMGSNCGACHSTQAWTPATFDHAKSGFPLTNAHAGLVCARCHTNPNTFGGLSPECVSCHSKPSSHPSFYWTQCTRCHTTVSFTPVSYTAAHTFPLNHGGAGQVCTTCHTTTFSAYTCGKCHDPSRIDGHAGRSLSNCASCHPKGRSGDSVLLVFPP